MTPLTPAEMDARIARYAAEYPEAFDDQTIADWFEALATRQREYQAREQAQVVILAEAVQVAWIGTAVDAAYAPQLAPQQGHEAATITALADATRAAHEARR